MTALSSNSLIGAEDQISANHKQLIGEWKVLREPKTPSPASGIRVTTMEFTETDLIYRTGVRGHETNWKEFGPIHYEVDTTKSPMWITLSKIGEKKFERKGIYRFVDDQLQIVWGDPSKERPISFDQIPQNSILLRALVRATRIEPNKEVEENPAPNP